VLLIHKSSVFPSKAHSYVIVKIYIQNPAINKSKHVGFCVKIDITVNSVFAVEVKLIILLTTILECYHSI